ncbi:hypothetical protein [Aquimarina sp. AD10]|uniref:hypothetical protein n=1 Tax=Aquimarina sp. AD10 TaxID=1714849 RepID=UPI0011C3876D|nr:hypothetical protein [Aquimarina sp. AD10]
MKTLFTSALVMMTCFMSFSQSSFTTKKCKNSTNERVRKNCVIKEIQKYVNDNYDITAISSDTKPGANRIYTRFKIDTTGEITDIQAKASSFPLEIEAIRVLASFPDLIPIANTDNTLESEDIYTLLITFEVNKTQIEINPTEKQLTGN